VLLEDLIDDRGQLQFLTESEKATDGAGHERPQADLLTTALDKREDIFGFA
jgi:hypothetical protein